MFALGKAQAAARRPRLQAITIGAGGARLLGLGEETGTPRPGRRADLLAVAGDPTRESTRPRAARLVVACGRVHRRTNDGR